MKLFFFDTDDGERTVSDEAGIVLPDEAEAVEQAVSLLRDLSHVRVVMGTPRAFSVRVRGAEGEPLYAASLRLTVDRAAAPHQSPSG